MKRLPRSDGFWLLIFIGFSLAVVIVAVVNIAGHGAHKQPPAYQNAPSTYLSPPEDGSLADPTLASEPPIEDATFLRLHKVTRLTVTHLFSDDYASALRPYITGPSALSQLQSARAEHAAQLAGTPHSDATNIVVQRPSGDGTRTQTSAQLRFVSTDPQSATPTTTVTATYFWQLTAKGWMISDLAVSYAAG